jgi:hypothetical protein
VADVPVESIRFTLDILAQRGAQRGKIQEKVDRSRPTANRYTGRPQSEENSRKILETTPVAGAEDVQSAAIEGCRTLGACFRSKLRVVHD